MVELLTLGDIARKFGIQLYQVRRLYERKLLPEPFRLAGYRIVPASQLPKVKKALIEAGYIKE